MNTFCRIWEAGGQASLITSTEVGELKAKLEIQLGSPAAPRPGAPSTTSGHPAASHRPSHRPCHRGPAAKARSRARAAAYQAKKAAAAATVASTATAAPVPQPPPPPPPPPAPALPPATRMIKFLPRKTGTRPSFSQLDGEDDTVSSPPPSSTPSSTRVWRGGGRLQGRVGQKWLYQRRRAHRFLGSSW